MTIRVIPTILGVLAILFFVWPGVLIGGPLWDRVGEIADKCPNIAGTQWGVPSGRVIDDNGNCVPRPKVEEPPPSESTKPSASASAKPNNGTTNDGGGVAGTICPVINGRASDIKGNGNCHYSFNDNPITIKVTSGIIDAYIVGLGETYGIGVGKTNTVTEFTLKNGAKVDVVKPSSKIIPFRVPNRLVPAKLAA